MPANKNAMTRYKILDELLSDRYHDYTLDDLTEEVNNRLSELDKDSNGVVRRTIEKDLRYLEYEGPFLVEIERYTVQSYDSQNKGRSLNNAFDMLILLTLFSRRICPTMRNTCSNQHCRS
jgi:DNA-binding HxlR family transcriptional regulator